MIKTPYKPTKRKFDLKFLLCGNSGSGKTHFCGTYTAGPVHFYMLDKGGEKTLDKLVSERPKGSAPISVDNFSADDVKFSTLWKAFATDEKAGFFDEMAEQNGLVVLDSLTTANEKAIKEIMALDGKTPAGPGRRIDHKKGMSKPHWGQLLNWMTDLISGMQNMPCASATTVHLHTLMDENQAVVARYPSVNGQFRQRVAKDYDETYLLETRGENHVLCMKEKAKFEAKSRAFSCSQLRNYTLQDLSDEYTNFNTLADAKKKGGK